MSLKAVLTKVLQSVKDSVADDKKGSFADAEKLVNELPDNIGEQPVQQQQQQQQQQAVPDTSKLSPELKQYFEGMQSLLKAQGEQLAVITQKEKDRETALATQAKADLETKVTAKIDEMKKDGRIAPQDADAEKSWRSVLMSGFDVAVVAADKLPKAPVQQQQQQQQQTRTAAKTSLGKAANAKILDQVLADLPVDTPTA